MIPHTQRYRHDPEAGTYGDCGRTAIACLLNIPRDSVPHFADGLTHGKDNATYWTRKKKWLRDQGLVAITLSLSGDVCLDDVLQVGSQESAELYWMLTGTSRNGTNHVVVCQDGRIVHDPSIDQSGIQGPTLQGWLCEYLVPLLAGGYEPLL